MSHGIKVTKKKDIIYYTVQSFEEQGGVIHGFSARHGGVSLPPFASLNLGFHTGDNPEAVKENRTKFCNALGIDPAKLVTAEQVHSDKVAVVTAKDAGSGALSPSGALVSTDAMVTREQVPLMAFYADCVPILIYDPVVKAVGVVHSGWSGTVLQIAAKTIRTMAQEFGTDPANCFIGIGPSIGPCCYEVDDKVIDRVKDVFSYWQDLLEDKGNGHWNLDLWEINRQSLIEAGVPAENITVSGVCTKCNSELLFSYRGEHGTTGRLAAVIMIK
jgi:polyphenol oxidase